MIDKKWSFEEFADNDTIDKIKENLNSNDSDGYTAMCFAAMNPVAPLQIIHMSECGARTDKKCSKGKTPFQCAVMSCNEEAVKVLLGKSYNTTKMDPELGIPICKYDDRYNVVVCDDKGNPVYEEVPVSIKNPVQITYKDIVDAASSPNGNIMKAIGEVYNTYQLFTYKSSPSGESQPLMLATERQCYDSVDVILSKCYEYSKQDSSYSLLNDEIFRTVKIKDTDGADIYKSSYSIAYDNCDTGIIAKFLKYINDNSFYSVIIKTLMTPENTPVISNVPTIEGSILPYGNPVGLDSADAVSDMFIEMYTSNYNYYNDYKVKSVGYIDNFTYSLKPNTEKEYIIIPSTTPYSRLSYILSLINTDKDFIDNIVNNYMQSRLDIFIDSYSYDIINSLYSKKKLSNSNIVLIKNSSLDKSKLNPGLR